MGSLFSMYGIVKMTEEVLGIFPCIFQKQSASAYLTTDRIIFHRVGETASDALVIVLRTITGFIMNKPRPGLAQNEQKALIKVQYRDGDEMRDRVIDFTGEDRFVNAGRFEELLRLHAGDKAEERRIRLLREAERLSAVRLKFLDTNPEIKANFEFMVGGGNLSVDEFWENYNIDSCLVDDDVGGRASVSAIPIPLRVLKESDLGDSMAHKNDITVEKREEIFAQFPKLSELYKKLVPVSISEKGFWKRFFHSQYFNQAQGIVTTNGRDPVFDVTLANNFPAEAPDLHVDPEIDLRMDFTKKEPNVFGYNEVTTHNPAFEILSRRFNEFSKQSIHNDVNVADEHIAETQNVFELEKLRRVRTRISLDHTDLENMKVDVLPVQPGLPGVASCTIALTTELVSPHISTTPHTSGQSSNLDEYMDRVIELSKFFFASTIGQIDKRRKILATLNKLKIEMNNLILQKSDGSALSMINSIISNIETISANL